MSEYKEDFEYHPHFYRSSNAVDRFNVKSVPALNFLDEHSHLGGFEFFFGERDGQPIGYVIDFAEAKRLISLMQEYMEEVETW